MIENLFMSSVDLPALVGQFISTVSETGISDTISMPEVNIMAILPEIILLIVASLMLIFRPLLGNASIELEKSKPRVGGGLCLIALFAAFVVNSYLPQSTMGSTFSGMLLIDDFGTYFKSVILIAAIITTIISFDYVDTFNIKEGEFYLLLLFSTVGMMLMGSSTDILSIFIALELMSIPVYVLVGLRYNEPRAREASFKYFILGALSTGMFVYGAALVYGSAGTTNLKMIAEHLSHMGIDPILLIGATFLIAGFLFKVSAVPFHMWTPDVYEGASLPITAFMSVGIKAAALSAFIRFVILDMSLTGESWILAIGIVAIASMVLGNTAALAQDNLKRLLAYSSIAHVGYMLVALITGTKDGISGILFYILIYAIVNLGIFAILIFFSTDNKECETIDDLKGLGFQYPLMAICMGIFMFALAGIPPTAGFMGKLYLFTAAVKSGYVSLVVIAVVASGVSVYYYLRIMVALFNQDGNNRGNIKKPILTVVVIFAALATLYLGILPGWFMDLSSICAGALF